MKFGYRDFQKAIYILCGLGFLVCIHIASVYVFAVHRFSVVYDPVLTIKARNDINRYLHHTQAYKMRAEQFVNELQDKFMYMRTISCRYKPNGMVEIILQADRPCMQLEHGYIVTTRNYIIPTDYYVPEVTKQLPLVKYSFLEDKHNRLSDDLFNYVTKLDATWLQSSVISWKHRNEIHIALATHRLQLLCNYHRAPDQQLLCHCLDIADELERKNPSDYSVLADIRFADQIIISLVKG